MKPNNFNYIQPKTVTETLEILEEFGEQAQILAGGQSLIAMLNTKLSQPEIIIDINFLTDIESIRLQDDIVSLGPNYRQLDFQNWKFLKAKLPLIYKVMPSVGHVQHRARGTVLGSICHGDPTSELPLCFIILDGVIHLQSKNGIRKIKAKDFYLGPLSTVRKPNELAIKIDIPIQQKSERCAFYEISQKHADYAIASFMAIENNKKIKFGLGALTNRPLVFNYELVDLNKLDKILDDLCWDLEIDNDQHCSAFYKRDLIRNLGKKTILKCINKVL